MKPFRVLEVSARFPPYRSGTGKVAYHNAAELARLGHQVFIASLDNHGGTLPPGAAWAPVQATSRIGNAGRMKGLDRCPPVDIVHLHLPFIGGGSQVAAFAKKRKVPLVVTYHQDLAGEGWRGFLLGFHLSGPTARVLRQADRCIVPTLDYAKRSRLSALFSGGGVIEIPNGVDAEHFSPAHSASRGPPGNRPHLLFVGALDRAHDFKGLPILFDALTRSTASPGLVIVGDGNLRAAYEKQARGLSDRVTFVGSVSEEALPEFYRSAAATVLPSTGPGEIFGLVLVESMACATPVIASDLPGVRTVVKHRETGLLVPPGDAQALGLAIDEILGSRERRKWGQNGRRRTLEGYDWTRIGAKLARVLGDAVDATSKPKG